MADALGTLLVALIVEKISIAVGKLLERVSQLVLEVYRWLPLLHLKGNVGLLLTHLELYLIDDVDVCWCCLRGGHLPQLDANEAGDGTEAQSEREFYDN